ncbi:MAG: hypothetical protein AAF639_15200 [Chloroflexota bacterium]
MSQGYHQRTKTYATPPQWLEEQREEQHTLRQQSVGGQLLNTEQGGLPRGSGIIQNSRGQETASPSSISYQDIQRAGKPTLGLMRPPQNQEATTNGGTISRRSSKQKTTTNVVQRHPDDKDGKKKEKRKGRKGRRRGRNKNHNRSYTHHQLSVTNQSDLMNKLNTTKRANSTLFAFDYEDSVGDQNGGIGHKRNFTNIDDILQHTFDIGDYDLDETQMVKTKSSPQLGGGTAPTTSQNDQPLTSLGVDISGTRALRNQLNQQNIVDPNDTSQPITMDDYVIEDDDVTKDKGLHLITNPPNSRTLAIDNSKNTNLLSPLSVGNDNTHSTSDVTTVGSPRDLSFTKSTPTRPSISQNQNSPVQLPKSKSVDQNKQTAITKSAYLDMIAKINMRVGGIAPQQPNLVNLYTTYLPVIKGFTNTPRPTGIARFLKQKLYKQIEIEVTDYHANRVLLHDEATCQQRGPEIVTAILANLATLRSLVTGYLSKHSTNASKKDRVGRVKALYNKLASGDLNKFEVMFGKYEYQQKLQTVGFNQGVAPISLAAITLQDAEQNDSGENLRYLRAIGQFLKKRYKTWYDAKQIFDIYLSADSRRPINLNGDLWTEIPTWFDNNLPADRTNLENIEMTDTEINEFMGYLIQGRKALEQPFVDVSNHMREDKVLEANTFKSGDYSERHGRKFEIDPERDQIRNFRERYLDIKSQTQIHRPELTDPRRKLFARYLVDILGFRDTAYDDRLSSDNDYIAAAVTSYRQLLRVILDPQTSDERLPALAQDILTELKYMRPLVIAQKKKLDTAGKSDPYMNTLYDNLVGGYLHKFEVIFGHFGFRENRQDKNSQMEPATPAANLLFSSIEGGDDSSENVLFFHKVGQLMRKRTRKWFDVEYVCEEYIKQNGRFGVNMTSKVRAAFLTWYNQNKPQTDTGLMQPLSATEDTTFSHHLFESLKSVESNVMSGVYDKMTYSERYGPDSLKNNTTMLQKKDYYTQEWMERYINAVKSS